MIEPKDGEWWMCDRNGNGVKVPLYNDDGRWCESEFDIEYNYSEAHPLYKMVKVVGAENIEFDYECGMREAMKDIAKSCGRKFSVDIGYLDLPKLVDELVSKDKPKPRTKVVYEPLQCVHKWQLVKAVEDGDNGGEQIYVKVGDEYDDATPSHAVDSFCTLYRKVVKKIDWRVDADDFFYKTKLLGNDHTFEQALADKDLSDELVGFCHLVASLTDKPE